MNRYNILVVEDDPIIGVLLVDILIAMGHEVCGLKTTAAGAVAAAAGCSPNLMLVDVQLGSGSGIAAVTEICRTKKIPYVYMTGAPLPIERTGDIVLYKPFEAADLARAIARISLQSSPN